MQSLYNIIDSIPAERTACIIDDKKITFGELTSLYECNKKIIEMLQGLNIVINGKSRQEFALLLCLLDGRVNRMLFLPSDINKDLHEDFYNQAEINYEVSLVESMLRIEKCKALSGNNLMEETEWVIPTSGTTNVPKLIVHTFASLTRTAKRDILIGKNFVWGLVFDIYRFSGIQVFLQSILSGSTLVISESNDSMSKILNTLTSNNCNALSATPSFWRKALMSTEIDNLKLGCITMGGEIADQNILSALKTKFSKAKITHIYASTEVGVGFSVTDKLAGFPYAYIQNGINGMNIKIDGNGLMWINPGKQAQKYISTDKMYDDNGYINTGDLVTIKENRVLFLGRDSGAINVGGNKVQPEEVENILISSKLLLTAHVYAKSNPMMGALVCADVVIEDDKADKKKLKKEILNFCRDKLEAYKIPAVIKFVPEIETTQSGKLKRN